MQLTTNPYVGVMHRKRDSLYSGVLILLKLWATASPMINDMVITRDMLVQIDFRDYRDVEQSTVKTLQLLLNYIYETNILY